MAKDNRGKKYRESIELIDIHALYELDEAVELLLQTAKANFDETVDLSVRLGVDPKHADQLVRGAVVLPHGTGIVRKVLVIAKEDKQEEAKEAGADFVGGEEVVDKIINDNWLDFDVVVATPDMMGVVGRIGRVLGPKGLMPNPKSGTVTFDIKEAVEDIKAGKVEYRVDQSSIVHVPVGKVSFGAEKILDNLRVMLKTLIDAKPSAAKGVYMQSSFISSTMGPGIKINGQRIMERVLEAEKEKED